MIGGIEHCDTFIIFGSRAYGEDTGNSACTYYESKFALDRKKRIILIRAPDSWHSRTCLQCFSTGTDAPRWVGAGMIPFDEEFEHLQARMLFGMNKFQILWELGTPMPADLPARIVEAMELGGQGATAL